MKKQRNVNLCDDAELLLVAVGQMAQTIIPALPSMAKELNVREGAVQSVMAAYLTWRFAAVLRTIVRPHWPPSGHSDRHYAFMVATVIAITTHSLTVLVPPARFAGR